MTIIAPNSYTTEPCRYLPFFSSALPVYYIIHKVDITRTSPLFTTAVRFRAVKPVIVVVKVDIVNFTHWVALSVVHSNAFVTSAPCLADSIELIDWLTMLHMST